MTATEKNHTTAVSAPGKVLLAGGYLVLDRAYTGLVFGLSARINVIAQEIITIPGVQLTEIVVESPQFLQGQWRYGYHLADEDGGIKVTQLQVGSNFSPNPFVETALSFALTYISRAAQYRPSHSVRPSRLTILADNDYYSQPAESGSSSPSSTTTAVPASSLASGPAATTTATKPKAHPPPRFARFPTTLSAAHKTGLGSSAALVTALTAACLTHYLDPSLFDLSTRRGKAVLHNLAQASHCAAQGKIGSGFDVAAAVYGSCRYRRFSPSVLAGLTAPGEPGFGAALQRLVESTGGGWDQEVVRGDDGGPPLPRGMAVRMCDVDCGTQTVGMVKTVLAWRAQQPAEAGRLWDELQARNEALARALSLAATAAGGEEDKEGERERDDNGIAAALAEVRRLVREMGRLSGAQIEPASQTELLDALGALRGVYGGVVPGAGGFDALALLMRDDEETAGRVEAFLEGWGRERKVRVRLLGVKGEMEGVRMESLVEFDGWV